MGGAHGVDRCRMLSECEMESMKPDNRRKSPSHFFPDGKISEAILAFADPYLDLLPTTTTDKDIEDIEKVLGLIQIVWNAVVLAEAKGNSFYLLDMKRRVAKHPANAAIVDSLIQRKRELFPDDLRLLGDFTVLRRNGRLHLRAEARSPFEGQ
jgi:hypothetical protein